MVAAISWKPTPQQKAPKNVVVIKHTAYTTYFDTVAHYPVLVTWDLTADMLSKRLVKRTNNFNPDPQLEKYTDLAEFYDHSGFDRGHNADALDFEYAQVPENECFYYSNMCPQLPALNRGNWKELESYCRHLAKKDGRITIWCGSRGSSKKLGNVVSVPTSCWKVIIDRKTGIVEAYEMPNVVTVNNVTYDKYKLNVSVIEKETGFSFK